VGSAKERKGERLALWQSEADRVSGAGDVDMRDPERGACQLI
jgi:hypothetical protein